MGKGSSTTIVTINDRYKIHLDDLNINLMCKTDKKDGTVREEGDEDGWACEGHYSSWESAFKRLFRLFVADKIVDKDTISLNELKNVYVECLAEIKKITKTFDATVLEKR